MNLRKTTDSICLDSLLPSAHEIVPLTTPIITSATSRLLCPNDMLRNSHESRDYDSISISYGDVQITIGSSASGKKLLALLKAVRHALKMLTLTTSPASTLSAATQIFAMALIPLPPSSSRNIKCPFLFPILCFCSVEDLLPRSKDFSGKVTAFCSSIKEWSPDIFHGPVLPMNSAP